MIILVSILLILPLSFQLENNKLCTEITNYKNGLPASIKQIPKNDFFGAIYTFLHKIFMIMFNNMPDYHLVNCDTHLIKLGSKNIIKVGFRPRGCCVHCCRIDTAEEYLSFHLYKSNKREILPLSSKRKAGKLKAIGFNSGLITIFWLHGFSEDGYNSRSLKFLINLYRKRNENYNLVMIDYSELAPVPWYFEAIDNVKLIAKAVAKFVIFYHKTGELSIENIHMLGVSLGAQAASHIAKEIAKFKKIARLTPLDPAFTIYPFISNDSENISKDDAEFVDVIYSTSNIFGYKEPTGHANFYVEYPTAVVPRPGCELLKLLELDEFPMYAICDHLRAYMMYLETITNPYLYPVCQNATPSKQVCGYLGFAANKSTTFGTYYITPNLAWTPWHILEDIGYSKT